MPILRGARDRVILPPLKGSETPWTEYRPWTPPQLEEVNPYGFAHLVELSPVLTSWPLLGPSPEAQRWMGERLAKMLAELPDRTTLSAEEMGDG